MKRKEFLEKMTSLEAKEIHEELHKKADEILKLRIRHSANQLETPHRIRAERKNYARLLTLKAQKVAKEQA